MTNNSKNNTCPRDIPAAPESGKTSISGPVLDRLIKEKMARTTECDGVAAMPVIRVDGRAANWRVPGYTGDVRRIPRCEAAIRDYLEFLASQFDLSDE